MICGWIRGSLLFSQPLDGGGRVLVEDPVVAAATIYYRTSVEFHPMEQWMREAIDALTTQHGAVPPPWFMYDVHPHSICWRMGGGETHMMVWWTWWPEQQFSETEAQ
jgi:hypothetical protein